MTGPTFRLQLQSGPLSGQAFDLVASSLTIGRYPLADIVIDDPDIAYRHALLTRVGDSYRIADLASDSGTYVNGRRIGAEPVALAPGDIILLGSRLTAAFLLAEVEPGTATGLEATAAAEGEDRATDKSVASTGLAAAGEYDPPAWEESLSPHATTQTAVEPGPPPIHSDTLPAMPRPHKGNGRIVVIAAVVLVALFACCCSATLFMYFIGGDWLLNQLGYLP